VLAGLAVLLVLQVLAGPAEAAAPAVLRGPAVRVAC